MAELLINVHGGPRFEDGDIIHACSDKRICLRNTEGICHHNNAERNGGGYIKARSLWFRWMELCSLYKFVTASRTEVLRINLVTDEQELFGPIRKDGRQAIDLPRFLDRRRSQRNHCLARKGSQTIWFGGHNGNRIDHLDAIWEKIEGDTPMRRRDFAAWPWGQKDLCSFLVLPAEDMDESTATDLESPLTELHHNDETGEDTEQVKKQRKHNMPWRDVLQGATIDEVLDRSKQIDVRDKSQRVRRTQIRRKRLQDVALDLHSQ